MCTKFNNVYLKMIIHLVTNRPNWLDLSQLSSTSKFVFKMSEFQLFKLLASYSNQSDLAASTHHQWMINYFLSKLDFSAKHILPSIVLGHSINSNNPFPITAIFLAHSLESLLSYYFQHHSHYQHHKQVPNSSNFTTSITTSNKNLILDLIITANEFMAMCLDHLDVIDVIDIIIIVIHY